MIFFIGSTNPVKIKAVEQAVAGHFPDASVRGVEVESGVAAQPMSDEETRRGAAHRASAALAAGLVDLQNAGNSQPKPAADEVLGVGLEGGVFSDKKTLWSTVWVAVTNHAGKIWVANGARFPLPAAIAKPILAGQEMGDAIEQMTGEADLRRKQGMIGVMTNNFSTRTIEYEGIARLAIGLWYGSDKFQEPV